MQIKVQINDKKSFEELLEHRPDMELRIKDAIADAVGKRVFKAAQSVLNETIETAAKNAVIEFCEKEQDGEWFKKNWSGRELVPSQKLLNKIKESVKDEMMKSVWEEIQKMPEYEVLKTALRAKLNEINGIDAKSVLVREARKALSSAMGVFSTIARGAKDIESKEGKE